MTAKRKSPVRDRARRRIEHWIENKWTFGAIRYPRDVFFPTPEAAILMFENVRGHEREVGRLYGDMKSIERMRDRINDMQLIARDLVFDSKARGRRPPNTQAQRHEEITLAALASGRYGYKTRVEQACARLGIKPPTRWAMERIAARAKQRRGSGSP
jgi:hypothetical protein